MSSPINIVDDSSENNTLYFDFGISEEKKGLYHSMPMFRSSSALLPIASIPELKINEQEIETKLTEEEKDLFSKLDIKYKEDVKTFRKFSNPELYLPKESSTPKRIKSFSLKSNAAIFGALNIIAINKISDDKNKQFVKFSIVNSIIVTSKIFTDGALEYLVKNIKYDISVSYIKILLRDLNDINIPKRLVKLMFEHKIIDSLPDIIEFINTIPDLKKICFKLAIQHDENLVAKFEKDIEISYYYIRFAIQTGRSNEFIERLINIGMPKLNSNDKDDDTEHSLLTYSISYNNPYIRDILIKKLESLSFEIDWILIFESVMEDVFEYEKDKYFTVESFNYIFDKIKILRSQESLSVDKDLVYSKIWYLREIFLAYPLEISKPFIDKYLLEKIQKHEDKLTEVPTDQDVVYSDDDYGLSCRFNDIFNKESVLYYYTKFPSTYIPGYYLTQEDLIYLISAGFDYNLIKYKELKPIYVDNFIKLYQNTKNIFLDDISTYVPPVIKKLIADYI